MPRPTTKITSFPPQTPAPSPVGITTQTTPVLPPPLPLEAQPQNIGLPPELIAEEPLTYLLEMTIDELIEFRMNTPKSERSFWCAGDVIWKKRDKMYLAHHLSQMKAFQDLTIALYTVNKKKVPKTVGQPFESD